MHLYMTDNYGELLMYMAVGFAFQLVIYCQLAQHILWDFGHGSDLAVSCHQLHRFYSMCLYCLTGTSVTAGLGLGLLMMAISIDNKGFTCLSLTTVQGPVSS